MDLDVLKLWEEGAATRKPSAAFVVIGHVDHGKSTLMGRLLLDTGAVSQRDIDKWVTIDVLSSPGADNIATDIKSKLPRSASHPSLWPGLWTLAAKSESEV